MWKDYSRSFIKNSRASSVSIMVAAFIASLFLSFLCCMFYNFWVYEVEKIIIEEGGWQGRITGIAHEEDILTIQNFANVEKAIVNEELSTDQETVIDVYFRNARTIFQDMPLIVRQLGLEDDAASYHLLLLSRYLIHDPQDETPPLLMTFYLVVLLLLSLSLILVIHNSFAVSMNARVHQFGIFSSIGATPGQIRTCLMQEAAVLCAAPVIVGIFQSLLMTLSALMPDSFAATRLVLCLLGLSSGLQMQTFHRVEGHEYTSIMVMGNMKRTVEAFSAYLKDHETGSLKKALLYIFINSIFCLGSAWGFAITKAMGDSAIIVPALFLLFGALTLKE
mgnify:CR=1 FL=1